MKVVGFAHSWAQLYTPAVGRNGKQGITIALHKLAGITSLSDTHVEVLAGTSFAQLYAELREKGLTLAWSPGGIQGLTVGGAVSVGFHGSQMSLGGVSSVVSSLRVYDTAGNAHDLTDQTHPEAMKAARMGLGMCGIISRVSLPVVPEFHLRRRRWRVNDVEGFFTAQLPQLKAEYDRFHWWVLWLAAATHPVMLAVLAVLNSSLDTGWLRSCCPSGLD
jgi:FAD/FMN-containing dehydrogenase